MAVEKRLEESEIQLMDPDTNAQEVEVAIVNPEAVAISTEDGGVIIDFAPEEDDVNSAPDLGPEPVVFITPSLPRQLFDSSLRL